MALHIEDVQKSFLIGLIRFAVGTGVMFYIILWRHISIPEGLSKLRVGFGFSILAIDFLLGSRQESLIDGHGGSVTWPW